VKKKLLYTERIQCFAPRLQWNWCIWTEPNLVQLKYAPGPRARPWDLTPPCALNLMGPPSPWAHALLDRRRHRCKTFWSQNVTIPCWGRSNLVRRSLYTLSLVFNGSLKFFCNQHKILSSSHFLWKIASLDTMQQSHNFQLPVSKTLYSIRICSSSFPFLLFVEFVALPGSSDGRCSSWCKRN
jgi:hypothetical protein